MKSINKEQLFSLFDQDHAILAPNNRLASYLNQSFYHQNQKPVQEKPHCLPASSYFNQLYQDFLLDNADLNLPFLLSPVQVRCLWQSILEAEPELICSKGLLDAVIDAWKNAERWCLSFEDPAFSINEQCSQFQQWWQHFRNKLETIHAISDEQILPSLIEHNHHPEKHGIIWVCFDDYSPVQKALQTKWQDMGVVQYSYQPKALDSETFLFAAEDEVSETAEMLHWLGQRLDAGDEEIAVIVPDLAAKKRLLQRKLQETLSDDLYNISLGETLTEYPIVAHALQCLTLDKKFMTRHQAQILLCTPFVKGAGKEMHPRAALMQECKLLREKQNRTSAWIAQASSAAPVLSGLLEQLQDYPQKASPRQWAQCFIKRLEQLGFPGDSGLNSSNYQCLQRFINTLELFTELGLIYQEITFDKAISLFSDLCEQSIFQPQSRKKPIQIMGLLEAAGSSFDSLWVMGLSDLTLPVKPKLSAFIPKSIQVSLNMPHSSAEREAIMAGKLIQDFRYNSKSNIFSYPKMTGDTPNLPSPLIQDFKHWHPTAEPRTKGISQLQALSADYLVPLKEGEAISGGSGLLANQAKCPFKAFATHRLKAKGAQTAEQGLDALERGNVAHKIMELLWADLGSQQGLMQTSSIVLDEKIAQAVQLALSELLQEEKNSFPLFVQQIEMQRLAKLARDCLEWEKQRAPFSIDALEKEHQMHLQGLDLKVRVDRIDVDEHGKKWLIDYKSSIPSSSPWEEERPKEPQLLLYALLDEAINTLMFIQLKAGHINSKSFGEEKIDLKHHKTLKDRPWSDLRASWQTQLEHLAQEIKEGHCPPDPINNSICQHCDFKNLCRYQMDKSALS